MANASDKKEVEKMDEREKRGRELELSDMANVLSTQSGLRFVWRLLANCGVFQSSFTGNNTTFFNEGQRNIGLKYLTDINDHCPEAYIKMLQESRRS